MTFTSVLDKPPLKEFLVSLSHEERALFKEHTACIPTDTVVVHALMIAGANLMPHGHFSLAEKSLLKGVELAEAGEEKARLHLNLAQLYHDLYQHSNAADCLENCFIHCQECLKLGFFDQFIKDNFLNSLGSSHMPVQ